MSNLILIALFLLFFFLLVTLTLVGLVNFLTARKQMQQRLRELAEVGQASTASTVAGPSLLRADSPIARVLFQFVPLERFQKFVRQSGSVQTPLYWLILIVCLGMLVVLICLLTHPPFLISLCMIGLAIAAPLGVLAYLRYRRLRAFEVQFPEALGVLARAVRAGHAFTTGLKLIAEEMPEPVSGEFRRTFEEQNLGLPLRAALENFSQRMSLPDVHIFVSSLQIQHEVGGNLAEVLDNLAEVMRQRFRLLRQIQIYAAEGKLSMYILMAFPPALGVLLFFVNRGYIEKLFTDPVGRNMLAGAVILQFIGYLVIRRMISMKF